ncbi:HAMP domain-containing sensor histidine kinase [Oceanirhabdus sp. W0125-5]|uniref:HAMP domain-containing sensor histidine kinase n=1 Tax=Oceanirhabdus sp. W0125-5 TaxID=2999116 RepID=UPI0022F2B0A8|nr:HAMP domain-containing sensor histidine kinase [Oceanirhabdus sp. W0125-5]WBW97643.1 HAMP domain-containing sensor histidine kinase [Oceanirhabdus sp. W0125-5]
MNIMLDENPEFKKIIKKILGIFFIFFIAVNILLISINYKMTYRLNQRTFHVMGKVVAQNPEMEKVVYDSLTEELDDSYIQRGTNVFMKYGYRDSNKIQQYDSILDIVSVSKYSINLMIIILFILCFISIRAVFKELYQSINKLTNNAEKIVEGNYAVVISNEKEGDISKLSFQFNQMSKRLKRTVQQLTEEKEFLKDMISNISHQLKTPLASLKMFNELLLDGTLEEKEVAVDFLEKSLVQIDRMEWLIQSLLKITRLETGVIEINKKEYNLSKTVIEEVAALKYNANIKKQNLSLYYDSDYVFLEHDRRWLGEAIRNIIKNSIDYTKESGNIDVILQERESLIRISIKDNGVGIHEKDIPKIFNRFYQGKNTLRNDQKRNGTGIGLSLSEVIVEKHDGYIEVKSEVNKGSEFTIVFPKR